MVPAQVRVQVEGAVEDELDDSRGAGKMGGGMSYLGMALGEVPRPIMAVLRVCARFIRYVGNMDRQRLLWVDRAEWEGGEWVFGWRRREVRSRV